MRLSVCVCSCVGLCRLYISVSVNFECMRVRGRDYGVCGCCCTLSVCAGLLSM